MWRFLFEVSREPCQRSVGLHWWLAFSGCLLEQTHSYSAGTAGEGEVLVWAVPQTSTSAVGTAEKAQLYHVFQRKWLHQYYKTGTSLYQCVLHRSVSSLLIILLEFLHTYSNFSELFLRGSAMEVLRTGTRPGVWLVQIIVLLLLSFIWKLTQFLLIWNVQLPILLFTENKHLEIIFNVYSYLWFFNKSD